MSKLELPPLPEKISLASELIKAREGLGLTQAQLAALSQVSLSALKGYETGRNMPGARELRELCQALQLTPNKLLFGTDTPFRARNDVVGGADERSTQVRGDRVKILMAHLSFEESDAIYRLAHSIAVARHGEAEVRSSLELSDFFTGMSRFVQQGKPIDADLIGQNPDLMEKMATAMKAVADGSTDKHTITSDPDNPEKYVVVSKKSV